MRGGLLSSFTRWRVTITYYTDSAPAYKRQLRYESHLIETALRERTILAATLLCELGRAQDPRLDVQGTDILELARQMPANRAFKHPEARPISFTAAEKILHNYLRGEKK